MSTLAAHRDFVNKQLAEKSFYHFIKQAWEHIEPADFVDNWHIKFLADHLQAFFNDEFEQDCLLINIPPGFGKSLIVSVFLPAWIWIARPEERFLTGSKTEELAIRDARRARTLLSSSWFQRNCGNKWVFKDDENRKRGYENDKQGFRNIFSIASAVTGKRGHRIIDDPNDAADTYNLNKLKSTNDWYGGTFSTRVNPLERTKTVIIMQRIAEGDFSSYILNTLKDKVLHICLPMEFDQLRKCKTKLGEDPRTRKGEFLWKAIKPEFIEEQKLLLGRRYAAQYQQRPAPLEGAIFKTTDFVYYKKDELPQNFDKIVDSTDIAEKIGKTNDYSCTGVWSVKDNKKYLRYVWRDKVEYPGLKRKFNMIGDQWRPHQRLVEEKSSGTPLVQELKGSSKYPLLPIKPKGCKEARAEATRPEFQAGNVLFPESAPWLNEYIEEMLLFPNGEHDDQVDMTTQFLNHVRENNRKPSFHCL